ncbi:DUF3618 domain-containing protein [Noviherbaspirillum sp. Root189]|uniref:DUF3618 domain-containing protein n=1 Tax=Noviherbaspirillum sp. Root189 TaxID=1736487 RepID=UPI00070F28B0|nr:DUF3618 domain-containing protein [Noviherbaspirillum sp. Root189]KRB83879.1 hypothetical protein ASE07_23450 [Noviherbaspirillum sp. Root189]
MKDTDNRSPEEIESDIERTRADFSSTVDAIQRKLSPSEMMDQAVDYALSTTPGAFGANLVNSVRDNPIPVALIGVGIAWLMAAGRQQPSYSQPRSRRAMRRSAYSPDAREIYRGASYENYDATGYSGDTEGGMLQRAASKASDTASGLKEKVSDVGQKLGSSASSMTDRVSHVGQTARTRLHETAEEAQARMSDMSRRSQQQYYRARDQFGQLLDEQPLVIAALGVALGAALGAAVPATRRENELMGSVRDDLLDKAKETALSQAETVKQSAQRVAEAAKQEAERVKGGLSNVGADDGDRPGSMSATESDAARFGSVPGQSSIH